jgi:hypothetical protein
MTHDNLATVRAGVSQEEARRLLHSAGSRSCWWWTMPIAASA